MKQVALTYPPLADIVNLRRGLPATAATGSNGSFGGEMQMKSLSVNLFVGFQLKPFPEKIEKFMIKHVGGALGGLCFGEHKP